MALGALLGAAALYWSLDYQPYILPNSDFFRIQRMAEDFAALRLPESFQQMPLVPLLMLPVAALLPISSDSYLHALSIINIALSLANLELVYVLSRAFLSERLAFVPVLVLLAMPQFTIAAQQAMLEPAIGFFSLSTLVALSRRSRWSYVLAGLCALTRYELSALLGVVFLVETLRNPRKWFAIGCRCALAGLPFAVWFAMSVVVPAKGNPYFDAIVPASLLDVAWNLQSSLPSPKFMVVFIALGWSLGLAAALRRDRALAAGIALFFALYLTAHYIFGRPLARYSYAVLWILPLLSTLAVRAVFSSLEPLLRGRSRLAVGLSAAAVGAAAIALGVRAMSVVTGSFPEAAVNSMTWYTGWSLLLVAATLGVVYSNLASDLSRRALACAGVALLLTTPMILSGGALAKESTGVYYSKAELVAALGWLARNAEPGAKVVISRYHELRDEMPTIEADRVLRYSDFDAETHEDFVRELTAKGVDYVVALHRPKRLRDPANPLAGRNEADYLASKIYLMEPFRDGEPAAGFETVVILPPPHPKFGHPTPIYRRISSQRDGSLPPRGHESAATRGDE